MKVSTSHIKKSLSKLKFNQLKKNAFTTLMVIAIIASHPAHAQVSTSSTLYETLKSGTAFYSMSVSILAISQRLKHWLVITLNSIMIRLG